MAELVRLQRFLATGGVAARRKAEALIVEGRVQVNGKVVTVLGTKIDPDRDDVLVDGEAVVALDRFYVLFNKPKGCITAVTDDRGRPVVMDYLPNLPVPVKPVGRLDFYTEGVLLLTNDGELAARLLAPGNHVPKTYHVKVHGQLAREEIQRLREGITLDDGVTTMPAEVEVLPGESKHTWLAITIHEGKHRQIHRMIEALGYQVDKLQRVAFATLTFHNLRIGDARELTQQELNELRDTVDLDHSAVARGRWRSDRESTDIARRARAKARSEAEAEAEEREANRLANVARRAAAADGEDDTDPADIDGQVWSADDGADFGGGGYDDEADGAPPARFERGGRGSGGRGSDRGPRSSGPRSDARGPRSDARGPRSDARGPRSDARGPRSDTRTGRGAPARGPRSDTRTGRGAPARGREDRFERGPGRSTGGRSEGRSSGGRGEGRSFSAPRPGVRSDDRGPRSGGATRSYGGPRPAGRGDERGPRSGGATRTYGGRSDARGAGRGAGRSFDAPSGGRSFDAPSGGRGERRTFGSQRPQASRGEGRSIGARGAAAPRGAASSRAGSFGSTKPGRSFGAAKPGRSFGAAKPAPRGARDSARGARDAAPRGAAPRGKGAGARAPQRGRKR